ncbi:MULTISPECIES: DUF3408 domain-containing protein [Rikenellaceae]|jgi:hypothetical protein|uniref:DUF3408 domain-containing protein n=1 Tax=Rikenellaceae TaxID=171550 RepID=UPI002597AB94|nr:MULTISPECIES: DUF3408 domain-containing protein [Rikenellaceae]MCX4301996.1 DUF3408 domain-containing protein [Alistipes sp.]
MSSRKAATEGIDEALLLDSIGRRKQDGSVQIQQTASALQPEPEQPVAESSKEGGRRKRQNADYTATFLKRNEIKTRQCVYISREIHNQISRIVNVISDKEITVGGYIDTVLACHLEQHKEEIKELYKKQLENLI